VDGRAVVVVDQRSIEALNTQVVAVFGFAAGREDPPSALAHVVGGGVADA